MTRNHKLYYQGWIWIENKITENQWKTTENIYPLFQMVHFDLFWMCPAIFGIFFSQKK